MFITLTPGLLGELLTTLALNFNCGEMEMYVLHIIKVKK